MAVYSHPESYPPTLNAINELSVHTDHIFILSRNIQNKSEWNYPPQAELILSGPLKGIRETEASGFLWKIGSFLRFTLDFFKIVRCNRPEWVICYDPIPLMAYRLGSFFLSRKPRLWYHNHDVSEISMMGRFSIGRLAVRNEQNYFNRIDLFSLPSEQRKSYFPLEKLKGQLFLIPNYPSKNRGIEMKASRPDPQKELKLLFQGHVGEGHGFEEIIGILPYHPDIKLTIIGTADLKYTAGLQKLAGERGVANRLEILKAVPYRELVGITGRHHLGIAIHKPVNIMYSTGALASNKIYEYAAAGLPILYFDIPAYREYLSRFEWAFGNDLSEKALNEQISYIRVHFNYLSEKALEDFRTSLNFEHVFQPVMVWLLEESDIRQN